MNIALTICKINCGDAYSEVKIYRISMCDTLRKQYKGCCYEKIDGIMFFAKPFPCI